MFNKKLKKRIKSLEELVEVRGRRIDALSDNQRELTKNLYILVNTLILKDDKI